MAKKSTRKENQNTSPENSFSKADGEDDGEQSDFSVTSVAGSEAEEGDTEGFTTVARQQAKQARQAAKRKERKEAAEKGGVHKKVKGSQRGVVPMARVREGVQHQGALRTGHSYL